MTNRTSPTSRPRTKSRVLVVLSALMIGSAATRIAIQAGPAIANEMAGSQTSEAAAISAATKGTESEQFHKMLSAFQERENRISAEEAELAEEKRRLEVAKIEIGKKLTDLERAENKLRATLALAEGVSEADLARLTAIYERMKPKEAAAMFDQMDPRFAAGFLGRMKPDAAARILVGLEPKTAYSISVVMAGRHAQVPKE